MLASQAGLDGGRRVPVVRRGANEGVDSRVVECLAEVADALRLAATVRSDRLDAFFNRLRIAIADIGDLSAGLFRQSLGEL